MDRVDLAGHDGEHLSALCVCPARAGPWPAVLVVHGRPRDDEGVMRLVETLSGDGFLVLAPDLTPPGAASEGDALDRLPDRRVLADLEAGLAWLAQRSDVDSDRLGVLGVAGGGTHAFLLACTSRRLACAVAREPQVVYAGLSPEKPIQPLELALNLSCPILLEFRGREPTIAKEHLERLRTTLDQFGKSAEVASFQDADPDVLLAAGGRYDGPLSFLRSHLEEPPS